MEKIRALIVDDEPIARRGIRQYLKGELDFEIIGECSNGQEAVAAIEKERPNLVFLDVQMPLLDGFGVARAVGPQNAPAIVFVTAYDEHAIAAFEVNALDYLLKPIDYERFQKTLVRVREQVNSSKSNLLEKKLTSLLNGLIPAKPRQYQERIAIRHNGNVILLNVHEIDWIVAQGNYVRLHTQSRTHILRETMNGIESKLESARFVRLRRSTIVRIDRIKELRPLFNGEYTVILKDNTEFTSSRRYRKNLDVLLKG